MSRSNPSTAKPPAHHTKMLEDCLAKGWIIRVGDSYEITPAGHEHTMRLTEELAKTELPDTYDTGGYRPWRLRA